VKALLALNFLLVAKIAMDTDKNTTTKNNPDKTNESVISKGKTGEDAPGKASSETIEETEKTQQEQKETD
jgi:hypothetical protein